MNTKDYYKAGFIMKPHGLKGEVTISLDPDSPADWTELETVFIDKNGTLVPYFVESVSAKSGKAFVKLEDVSTPEQAALLKNQSVFLPRDTRPKPVAGDFYDDEIIGFTVTDDSIGVLGRVKAIERAGMNRFVIVDYKQKEIMIPVQSPLLKRINRSKRKIMVSLPEGFLDI